MIKTKKMRVTLEVEYLDGDGRETPPNLWDWGAMLDLHPSEKVSVASWSDGDRAGNAEWRDAILIAASKIEENAGGQVTAVVVRSAAYQRTNNGRMILRNGRSGEKQYEHAGELMPVEYGEWADYEEVLLEHGEEDNLTHIAYSDSDINLAMLVEILAAVYCCKIERR
jgi:hypothetical protein